METSSPDSYNKNLMDARISIKSLVSQQFNADLRPAIDMDLLMSRCMGNMDFALSLLSELEASGTQYIETIAQHVATQKLTAAGEAAHSLKGAAAILGAEALRELAGEIESAGNANSIAGIILLVDALRKEMERCLLQIPKIRAGAAHQLNK